MQLAIASLDSRGPGSAAHEVVERKARGHSDSVCDALAENLSLGLSRFYLERFGRILHHNVDKALLLGGAARPAFGGGELVEPLEITLAGRATRSFGGVPVPVEKLAIELSRQWLRQNLRYIDAQRDVRIVPRLRETSPDLAAPSCARARPACRAPTTAPSASASRRSAATCDLADYFARKKRIASLAAAAARETAGSEVAVQVNAGDGDSADSIYLTVTCRPKPGTTAKWGAAIASTVSSLPTGR